MSAARSGHILAVSGVFVAVALAQLVLVSGLGTDVPFHDQWNVEGQWLYPGWLDGSWSWGSLFTPVNEHRIVWTHAMNLGLFAANGQWDPLVQMVVIVGLRAACAAGLAAGLLRGEHGWRAAGICVMVSAGFLPLLAWHAVLWGFESQVHFALGFGLLTLGLLGARELSLWRGVAGLAAGMAALLSMGPAALVPIALLMVLGKRAVEEGRVAGLWRQAACAAGLLVLAVALRVEVPEHAAFRASAGDFIRALGKMLAWPHVENPWAACVLNVPIVALVAGRVMRRRVGSATEDFVILVAAWSAAIAVAAAWARGGNPELAGGVPSRYVDFVVLLPLANAWAAVRLAGEATQRRRVVRAGAVAWGLFLLVGWAGLSAEVMRRLVLPRARDREAPVRLMREYQKTGDARVFERQPRLLVPHPDVEAVLAVLADERMRGKLPPSLQPEEAMGPLSRGARAVLGRQ